MKITTEFTDFECKFCLVSRQNMLLLSTVQLRLRWVFCRVFSRCVLGTYPGIQTLSILPTYLSVYKATWKDCV